MSLRPKAVSLILMLITCGQVLADDANPFTDCDKHGGDVFCASAHGATPVKIYVKGDDTKGTCFDGGLKCNVLLIGERSREELTIKWRIYVLNRKQFLFAIFRPEDQKPNEKPGSTPRNYPLGTPVLEYTATGQFVARFDAFQFDLSKPDEAANVPFRNLEHIREVIPNSKGFELFKFETSTTIGFKPEYNFTSLDLNAKSLASVFLSNNINTHGVSSADQLFDHYQPPTTEAPTTKTTPFVSTEPDVYQRDRKYRLP